MEKKQKAERLAELRSTIDAIDEAVHRLLIQRAEIIGELIEAKGISHNGAVFRPGREAEMMRRLQQRHQGALPLTTIEHVWREIISAFTAIQSPYVVHADTGFDPVAVMDVVRFYFGFGVPVMGHRNARDVIRSVSQGENALGVVPLAAAGAWWEELGEKSATAIMALLPFFEMEKREAALPCVVISPPLADPVPFEVQVHALRLACDAPLEKILGDMGILAHAVTSRGLSVLAAGKIPALASTVALDSRPVGGYFPPVRVVDRE
ncbi:MAG: chorismate mutase [Phyllobacterium sp.]